MSTVEKVIPTGTWTADRSHSQIGFAAKHMGLTTIRGSFTDFDATLEGGDSPSFSGVIRVASVDSGEAERDAHLRSPDFFDPDRYPEARLVAKAIESDRIVADLTLKGVTKEVEFDAELTGAGADPWGNDRVGLELEGEIDRTDFGVNWNAPLPGGGFLVGDKVKLTASFSFLKQA